MAPEDFNNKQWAGYLRRLSELHRDVAQNVISSEEAESRLNALKSEQQQFLKSDRLQDMDRQAERIVEHRIDEQKTEETMRRNGIRRSARRVMHEAHALDFKCQCKHCVRKHTITMADRDFLKELGITWAKGEVDAPVPEESNLSE